MSKITDQNSAFIASSKDTNSLEKVLVVDTNPQDKGLIRAHGDFNGHLFAVTLAAARDLVKNNPNRMVIVRFQKENAGQRTAPKLSAEKATVDFRSGDAKDKNTSNADDGGSGGAPRALRAAEKIDLINKAESEIEINAIVDGDERKTVKDAAIARIAVLKEGK